jgi:hypothetical protein
MSTIPPFDIPPEDPVLPQGESHIPPNSYFTQVSAPPAPSYTDSTEALMHGPNEEHMAQIQALYTERDQELILAWWSRCFLRPSEYVTDKPVVCNVAHVLAHAKGMMKAGADESVVSNSYAAAHMHWIAECSARKRWIEAQKAEWQKRRQERRAWLESIAVTQAQWDAYVEAAKQAYKDADAYPVPTRPVRE